MMEFAIDSHSDISAECNIAIVEYKIMTTVIKAKDLPSDIYIGGYLKNPSMIKLLEFPQ